MTLFFVFRMWWL